MNEFNLAIGTELLIDHTDSDAQSFSCATLIGFLYEQSLIVTLPKKKDLIVQVEKGDKLAVRFNKADTIYAFNCKVMEISQTPYPHLHLTYPENIQAKLLRRGNRIDVDKHALYLRIKNNDFNSAVTITNISENGGKLTSGNNLGQPEEKLTIELDIPHYPEKVELNCKICHTHCYIDEESNKETYSHGIEFFDINEIARSFINSFMHEHIEREKSNPLRIVPN
jgi:c-di-GMP-binding flagellar brake protein YcgR